VVKERGINDLGDSSRKSRGRRGDGHNKGTTKEAVSATRRERGTGRHCETMLL
jgi:hypothetical protein